MSINMNINEIAKATDDRVQPIFQERYQAIAVWTDQLFGALFVFQWALAVIFAMIFSPRTWYGSVSQVNIHVYASLLLGGILATYPIYLILKNPGTTYNRMVIAVTQILFSILFIHVTGGRIETHFHVFGSLAFLAFYRDWRVLLLATAVTALDHMVRGFFWPESVYGILVASPWRALEHTLWVVFEDVILFYSIYMARKELLSVAQSQVALQDTIITIEDKVRERTQALQETQNLVIEQQQAMIASSKMSALGEMAGGVAHEINTPLATIKVLAAQLKETLSGESPDAALVKEMVGMIEGTTDRIAKIVKGLRSFSRDGSKDPYDSVKVAQLIEETLSFCRERFKNDGTHLILEPFSSDVTLEGRTTELSQVLLNLLNNAHDAIATSDEKWIRLAVSETSDSVQISVSDSGPGIPPELREKIFQPFFTTKEIGKGTGLGLSVVLGIVRSHQGELTLNTADAATSFVLKLPKFQYQAA